jgi:hypothetical protein
MAAYHERTLSMKSARWLLLLPAAVAVLVLLPRVLDARFGLLDDAITLLNSQVFAHQPLAVFSHAKEHGRFFPFYLLYYSLIWLFAHENAVAFYCFNLLALAASAVCLAWAARRVGGTPWQSALTGIFFVLNLPVSSAFSTLSKCEVPQCLLLSAALAVAASATRTTLRLLFTFTLLLCAILTKETTYAVVPAAGAAFCFLWLNLRDFKLAWSRRQGLFLLAALAAAAVAYAAWSAAQPGPVAAGSYASAYSITYERIANSALREVYFILRSWAYLVPVLIIAILCWRRLNEATQAAIVEGLAWAAAFLVILLPWPGIFEYHMAPAAIGFAFAAGFALPALAQMWRSAGVARWLSAGAVAASLALLPLHVSTIVADQRIQMLVDRVNFQLIEELSRLPRDSRVFLNLPPLEYVVEARVHLHERFGRTDISVDAFDVDARQGAVEAAPYYIASAATSGFNALFVRGALLDSDTRRWNRALDRDVAAAGRVQKVSAVQETESLHDFAPQNIICLSGRFHGPCEPARAFFLPRHLEYGWTVSRVESEGQ